MSYSADELMRMSEAGDINNIARYSIYRPTTTTTTTTATTASTTTTTMAPIKISGNIGNMNLYIGLGLAAILIYCMYRGFCWLNKTCQRSHKPSPSPI